MPIIIECKKKPNIKTTYDCFNCYLKNRLEASRVLCKRRYAVERRVDERDNGNAGNSGEVGTSGKSSVIGTGKNPAATETVVRKRGWPKGSKNKTKK